MRVERDQGPGWVIVFPFPWASVGKVGAFVEYVLKADTDVYRVVEISIKTDGIRLRSLLDNEEVVRAWATLLSYVFANITG